MRREPVTSDVLARVGYDDHGTLEVEFRHGAVYQYLLVPPRVHRALMSAPSVGSYFNDHVRDVYHHVKVS